MHKYYMIFIIFFISSCTSIAFPEKEIIVPRAGYLDQNIRQIIGFMEILDTDKNYPVIHDILARSEKPCIGKDFVGYRGCFLVGLGEEQKKIINNTKMYNHEKETIYNKIALFEHSLRQEISFLEFYQEIDDLPSLGVGINDSGCRLIGYRIFDHGSFTGQSVVLSYWDSQEELSQILSKSQNLTPKSLSGVLRHENPCESHTWGPDEGHIFYFSQVGKNQYFFIKTSDGGGSGDFNYTIYWNHNESKIRENEYKSIATFPAYSGFTPIPRLLRDEEGNEIALLHRNIIEEFKNQPFQYITEFENQRTGYIYQIAGILTDITPGILFD